MMWSLRSTLVTVVDLILAFLAFFIGLRIVFRLFAANPETPFVNWVYGVSDNLIYPFIGIFPNLNLGTGNFDIVALIAMVAYLIIGQVIIIAIRAATTPRITERDHLHPNY